MNLPHAALSGLIGALVGVVLPLVLRRMTRDAAREQPIGGQVMLRYGTVMRTLGVVMLPFGVVFLAGPIAAGQLGALVVLGPLAAGCFYLFVDTLLVTHSLDEQGITCGSPWRKPARIEWQAISSLRYNAIAGWYVLRTADGRIGRVSPLVRGFRSFAEAAIRSAPRAAFNDSCFRKLSRIAEGASPLFPE